MNFLLKMLISKLGTYPIVKLAVALVVIGFVVGIALKQPSRTLNPVYSRIEDVRYMKHLELVTYFFESIVDVSHAEKSDKVYLLMVIPARVSCYIDLEHMEYVVNDSIIQIILPEPVIETPVLDLDSARIFNMNQLYVAASKKTYEMVVRNVQHSLVRAKEDVLIRARANGITSEANRLAEAYFRSLFTGLGLQVEFIVL